jgi:hypothetical protein
VVRLDPSPQCKDCSALLPLPGSSAPHPPLRRGINVSILWSSLQCFAQMMLSEWASLTKVGFCLFCLSLNLKCSDALQSLQCFHLASPSIACSCFSLWSQYSLNDTLVAFLYWEIWAISVCCWSQTGDGSISWYQVWVFRDILREGECPPHGTMLSCFPKFFLTSCILTMTV